MRDLKQLGQFRGFPELSLPLSSKSPSLFKVYSDDSPLYDANRELHIYRFDISYGWAIARYGWAIARERVLWHCKKIVRCQHHLVLETIVGIFLINNVILEDGMMTDGAAEIPGHRTGVRYRHRHMGCLILTWEHEGRQFYCGTQMEAFLKFQKAAVLLQSRFRMKKSLLCGYGHVKEVCKPTLTHQLTVNPPRRPHWIGQ
eukprot:2752681-Amphidinium_carterae.1